MARVKQKRAESPISSIAQGNALGIRHLPIMRPVRATLISHCFYSCPYRARCSALYPFTQGVALPFIHIFDNSQHLTFAEEIVKSCFESCISWT